MDTIYDLTPLTPLFPLTPLMDTVMSPQPSLTVNNDTDWDSFFADFSFSTPDVKTPQSLTSQHNLPPPPNLTHRNDLQTTTDLYNYQYPGAV